MAADFTFTGALDPEHHKHLYIERLEDRAVRRALTRVGTECVLVSLIGARQTGKTSLLNRLHAEYGAADSGWVAIKLDLMPLSNLDGEVWYRQFIALCCERLQKAGVHVTVAEVEIHCAATFIIPFSARGWTELLRLVCQRIGSTQRLLLSLDEISSIPRAQWEPFFSNVRAIHQAASSPNDSPEYRQIGLILAGAFVPSQLINIIEKSPFNVSTKIYMSHASDAQVKAHLKLIEAEGFTLMDGACTAIYEWSNGLPYHMQRLAAAIIEVDQKMLDEPDIGRLADDIMLDDAFLSHIMRQLQTHPALTGLARKI